MNSEIKRYHILSSTTPTGVYTSPSTSSGYTSGDVTTIGHKRSRTNSYVAEETSSDDESFSGLNISQAYLAVENMLQDSAYDRTLESTMVMEMKQHCKIRNMAKREENWKGLMTQWGFFKAGFSETDFEIIISKFHQKSQGYCYGTQSSSTKQADPAETLQFFQRKFQDISSRSLEEWSKPQAYNLYCVGSLGSYKEYIDGQRKDYVLEKEGFSPTFEFMLKKVRPEKWQEFLKHYMSLLVYCPKPQIEELVEMFASRGDFTSVSLILQETIPCSWEMIATLGSIMDSYEKSQGEISEKPEIIAKLACWVKHGPTAIADLIDLMNKPDSSRLEKELLQEVIPFFVAKSLSQFDAYKQEIRQKVQESPLQYGDKLYHDSLAAFKNDLLFLETVITAFPLKKHFSKKIVEEIENALFCQPLLLGNIDPENAQARVLGLCERFLAHGVAPELTLQAMKQFELSLASRLDQTRNTLWRAWLRFWKKYPQSPEEFQQQVSKVVQQLGVLTDVHNEPEQGKSFLDVFIDCLGNYPGFFATPLCGKLLNYCVQEEFAFINLGSVEYKNIETLLALLIYQYDKQPEDIQQKYLSWKGLTSLTCSYEQNRALFLVIATLQKSEELAERKFYLTLFESCACSELLSKLPPKDVISYLDMYHSYVEKNCAPELLTQKAFEMLINDIYDLADKNNDEGMKSALRSQYVPAEISQEQSLGERARTPIGHVPVVFSSGQGGINVRRVRIYHNLSC